MHTYRQSRVGGALAAVALTLAGCATTSAPYGLFDGTGNPHVDPLVANIRVVGVDGKAPEEDGLGAVKLTPGLHVLWLVAQPAGNQLRGTHDTGGKTMEVGIQVEACRRYAYFARHADQLPDRPWEIVSKGEQAIPGCKPAAAAPPAK